MISQRYLTSKQNVGRPVKKIVWLKIIMGASFSFTYSDVKLIFQYFNMLLAQSVSNECIKQGRNYPIN